MFKAKSVFVKCFLVLIIFSSLACQKGNRTDHLLHVAIKAPPLNLDPRLATDGTGFKLSKLIFNGLFRLNEKLELVPDLLESYQQKTSNTYHFVLRKEVRFHNGKELTADDVLYTYNSILKDEVASPFKSAFEKVKTIQQEGKYEFSISLQEPYAPFLTALSLGIVPKEEVLKLKDDFTRHPIGTGQYQFVQWQDDAFVELKAFPQAFQGIPKNAGIRFDILKDDNLLVLKLLKGDVDLALNGVPPVLLEKVKQKENINVLSDFGITVSYLGMNLENPILKQTKVRKAIALALNRDELIVHYRKGYARKANSILSPSNWAYNKDLPQIQYDQKEAMRLLDEAGYPDPDGNGPKPRFSLQYKTSSSKERIEIAQMIARQLGQIGVEVAVQSYEWGTFFDDIKKGNFELYSLQWVGVTEPDLLYDIFYSKNLPPEGLNRGRYKNKALDPILLAARKAQTPEARRKYYLEAQSILFTELPLIPLWYEDNVVAFWNTIEGVHLSPDASFKMLAELTKQAGKH